MLFVDALMRFGAIALLLVIAIASWQHRKTRQSAPYLFLASISVSALLLGYIPSAIQPPEVIHSIARFADIPHLVFVWLFALSLYDQDFLLKRWHVLVGLLYCVPILWFRLADHGLASWPPAWMLVYSGITSVLLMGHLIWVTLHGRKDDLIERRRNSRSYFVAVLFLTTVFAAVSELIPNDAALDRETAKVMAILPAVAFAAVWMVRINLPGFDAGSLEQTDAELSPIERALFERLQKYLIEDQGFRDPRLTIVSLSAGLGVSQHRLRALINHRLGHTNFSKFINGMRIDAICKAMDATETKDLPILTLALDAGFASISSFNKAFKSICGVTPSEYRAETPSKNPSVRNPSGFSRNPQDARFIET